MSKALVLQLVEKVLSDVTAAAAAQDESVKQTMTTAEMFANSSTMMYGFNMALTDYDDDDDDNDDDDNDDNRDDENNVEAATSALN